MKQETFTDIEYSLRKKKTKWEEFLEIMDEIIPRDEWVGVIEPYYPKGKRGHPPMGIEKMLRMYLLQIWFNLSDPATEDAIYDSYAMRKFTGIDFVIEWNYKFIILLFSRKGRTCFPMNRSPSRKQMKKQKPFSESQKAVSIVTSFCYLPPDITSACCHANMLQQTEKVAFP